MEKASAWSLGTEFMTLLKNGILGHIKEENEKVFE
jgi:hypothetical protein